MTESKIVSLGGESLPEPGEPNASVVKVLEEALETARAGELVGVVLVQVNHRVEAWWDIAGAYTPSYTVLGVLHSAAHRVAQEIDGQTVSEPT